MAVPFHLLLEFIQNTLVLGQNTRFNGSQCFKCIDRSLKVLEVVLGVILVVIRHIHVEPLNDAIQFLLGFALE